MRATLLLRLYATAARFAMPLVMREEIKKLRAHGTLPIRWQEKAGHASAPRPQGSLIWFHAASVGEVLSVLGLIELLGKTLPQTHFLLTSGTPTSADIVASRLPARCQHQFAPLDAPKPVARFLKHWTPDALVFVESEVWPNMILAAKAAGVPTALINARMSDKSLAAWEKRPKSAEAVLASFQLIETQGDRLADALCALGAHPATTRQGPNLKAHAAPLPQDKVLQKKLRTALGSRPVWIAASTHPGEEETVLAAHKSLLARQPDLCLILAPRHPERGPGIAGMIRDHGWAVHKRSAGQVPEGPVYLADTLGELGSLYPLAKFVFLGGSFSAMGGHNPFEVVQFGVPVLSGPNIGNFSDVYGQLVGTGVARIVPAPDRLAEYAEHWLTDSAALEIARADTTGLSTAQDGALDALADRMICALDLERLRAT